MYLLVIPVVSQIGYEFLHFCETYPDGASLLTHAFTLDWYRFCCDKSVLCAYLAGLPTMDTYFWMPSVLKPWATFLSYFKVCLILIYMCENTFQAKSRNNFRGKGIRLFQSSKSCQMCFTSWLLSKMIWQWSSLSKMQNGISETCNGLRVKIRGCK